MEITANKNISHGYAKFQHNEFSIGPACFDFEKVHLLKCKLCRLLYSDIGILY